MARWFAPLVLNCPEGNEAPPADRTRHAGRPHRRWVSWADGRPRLSVIGRLFAGTVGARLPGAIACEGKDERAASDTGASAQAFSGRGRKSGCGRLHAGVQTDGSHGCRCTCTRCVLRAVSPGGMSEWSPFSACKANQEAR